MSLARLADALGLPDLARWARGPWRITDGSDRGIEGELAGVGPHPTHEWVVGLYLDTPGGRRVPTFSSLAVNVPASTARNAPHVVELPGDPPRVLADTNALQYASAYGEVEHIGFGDFRVSGPQGDVYFGRTDGQRIPGQVGRAHVLDGPPEAVAALVAAVRAAPVRVNPARVTVSPRPRRLSWRKADEELDGIGPAGWEIVEVAPDRGLAWQVMRAWRGGYTLALVPDWTVGEEAVIWTAGGWESELDGGEDRAHTFPSADAAREHARMADGPRERLVGRAPEWFGRANPSARAGWRRAAGGARRVGADGLERWIVRDREHAPAFYAGPRRTVFRVYSVPPGQSPGAYGARELGAAHTFAAASELAGFPVARVNPWDEDADRYVPWEEAEPRLRSMRRVGPSADWIETAYQLSSKPDTVLFEDEDDRWLVLRRYFLDDGYAGLPEHLRAEADGGNDVIEEVAAFRSPTEALAWVGAGGLARSNPRTRVRRPARVVRVSVPRERLELVRAYLTTEDPHEWNEARTRLALAGVDTTRLRARRNPELWPAEHIVPDDDAAASLEAWRERRRAFAGWLGDVATRAGFPQLAGALASVAQDPYAHGGTREERAPVAGGGEAALETDPYGQTEAVRRRANVAAMRVLRSHQATRAPGGKMTPLLPGERQVLRLYSGMGGIDVSKFSADERALLTPAQQEYLRIQDERAAARVRIVTERGRAPKETELPQFGKVRGAFDGMIAQYFTPVEVAGGMIEWGVRVFEGVNGGTRPTTLLEPSAGIGRFLRAYELAGFGGSPRWDAVELDPDLADMLRLLYADQPGGVPRWGDVRVHNLAFEQFYASNPTATYDLVAANPPYAGRGPTGSLDPEGAGWADAAHYFMWRTLTMLRPRGVMVHLVPAGLLTGKDKQSRAIREALLLEGHLASAVMPPFEIFPQALLNLCISVWVKRPARLDRVLDADQAILDGRYFEDADTRQGIMGKPQGGNYRPEAITGEWSIETLRRQPIRVPPAELLAGARAPAMAPVGPGEAAAALRGLARAEGYDDESPIPSAEALGARVMRFRASVETDPTEARAGQRELVDDLLDFARSVGGRPHELRVPSGAKPSARLLAFFSAFDERGGLTPALTQLVDVPAGTYQGERSPRAVCLHLAAQRGEAYLPDIGAVLGRRVDAAELVLEPDVFFEPLHDDERGPLVFFRADEFYSGEAYAKIDWCEAVADERARFPVRLAPAQADAVRAKCRAMARRLVELVAPLPLGEVDIGVRSTWVHLARTDGASEWDCPLFVDFFREAFGVDLERVYVLQGVLVAEGANAKHHAVEGVLAYFNRVESTYDARGKKKSRQNENDALQDRIAADRKIDEQFAAFVRRHPDASKIEDRYNRAYRSWIERKYSTEPIPLARMPAEQRAAIRPHAWAAVRRAVERRGGIMALDVGLGKTASSLLTIALLRQQGRVRRPVFVVPNSVGPNWLSEVAMWLPDYRAVLIGATVKKEPGGAIRTIPDNPARMLAKLQAFASGKFDCAVIQQSTFERIPVDVERVREFFVQEFGVQREVALQKRKDAAARDRLKALQEELPKAVTTKKRQAIQDEIDKTLVVPWINRLKEALDGAQRRGDKKEVKRLSKQIDQFAKKQTPTDRERQTDQQKFDEWVGERVQRHRLAIDGITWEELNADYLVVDEAHEYKNLYGPASRYGKKPKYIGAMQADKVVGKCWDLWAKCALLRSTRDDTGVHLLTATPLKNSPLEAFNLLSYCTRAAFQARGLLSPEDFIDRYCRPESEPVLTVMGGFREDLVVRKFTSLHELRGIFQTFVDVKVALPPDEYARAQEDGRPLQNVVVLPLPTARSLTIHVPMDLNQEAYYDEYRRAASRAAEQAAASLCERAMRDLDADPTQLPRLRLPMLEGTDAYPIMVRTLRALAGQFPDTWRAAFDAKVARPLDLPLSGRGGFDELEEVEGQSRAQSEVGRLYGELRGYLENTDVRGALRMDDPELGTYGTKGAKRAAEPAGEDDSVAARPTVVADVDDDAGEEGEEGEEDDLFTVMDRMGKAALDLRLLGEHVTQHPPKYRAVAEKIAELKGCGHIVFSDINVTHEWIADAIERLAGVPRARIVSVTGALTPGERQQMANRLNGEWDAKAQRWVREPDIDVIIGGKAIEQGMNLQARSCAIHHLTFPWEPATVQQRNGRAVRQGNRLGEVFIFYYAAARSFDGYRLSLITGKRGWQRTLLESADRTTNNPGAEFTGPCAMLRQLSSDEALADEYCACMENAAAKKAEAIRRERAAEDFAAFVSALTSSKRDGPKQAYYAEQAEGLRARLLALDDAVFPRKDLIPVAERVPLWWDLKSGVPWIEGVPLCIANNPVMIESVNPVKGEIRIRQLGRWFATTWTTGEASARGGDVSATCDWSEPGDRAKLAGSYELRPSTLRLVDPELWRVRQDEGFQVLNRQYSLLPYLDGQTLKLTREADAAPRWRLLLPWTREDADAYLDAVRALPRAKRVATRATLGGYYAEYFGRVYPADLRDET